MTDAEGETRKFKRVLSEESLRKGAAAGRIPWFAKLSKRVSRAGIQADDF